jgi:hypothetical protein
MTSPVTQERVYLSLDICQSSNRQTAGAIKRPQVSAIGIMDAGYSPVPVFCGIMPPPEAALAFAKNASRLTVITKRVKAKVRYTTNIRSLLLVSVLDIIGNKVFVYNVYSKL